MGKATIDTNTFGRSMGRNGNYTTNYQLSGRELLTPDEVRMLDNRYAVLFIRGEKPLMDFKYDLSKHPNAKFTPDGADNSKLMKLLDLLHIPHEVPERYGAYMHGEAPADTASITIDDIPQGLSDTSVIIPTTYELLSNEDIEAIFE
jgi:type IV secretion system protein VirD4